MVVGYFPPPGTFFWILYIYSKVTVSISIAPTKLIDQQIEFVARNLMGFSTILQQESQNNLDESLKIFIFLLKNK